MDKTAQGSGSSNSDNKAYFLIIASLFILLLIPIWIFLVLPSLYKPYSDFSYSANVFSVDNFYDEEKNDFSGEKASKSTFVFRSNEINENVVEIENTFDVRTLNNESIFFVNRTYGINPKTGEHLIGYGDKDRTGYLFAPANLKLPESFIYWHINYDGPALMEFESSESLEGLTVYKYNSEYKNVEIDQTNQLTHLPGVPDKRGVRLEPNVTLWIEPVTGKMVSYKDETIAYFYDQDSKKILNPWNMFSNTITEKSIVKNVAILQSEKFTILLQSVLFPVILLILSIILTTLSLIYKYKSIFYREKFYLKLGYLLSSLVLAAGIIVFIGWILNIESLKSIFPGLVTMKFMTAISFISSGLIMIFSFNSKDLQNDIATIILPSASLIIILIMGTLLISSVFGISSGIENILIKESNTAVLTTSPGNPSVGTMIGFISIAIFGVISLIKFRFRKIIFLLIATIVIIVGLLALLGYILNKPIYYYASHGVSSAMAFHTSLLFITLGILAWIRFSQE